MTDQKKYVLDVLDALLDTWPLAKSLKVLVSTWAFSDETITALVDIFNESIKKVNDNIQKQKLEESLGIIHKIKNMESQEKKQIEKDLEKIISKL